MKRLLRLFVAGVVAWLVFLVARSAGAEPIRVVVSVGHRLGLAGEAPLKHAVRDATRVRDVFVQAGDVQRDHAILLEEPSAAQLMSALDRAAAIARTRRPGEVTLVFYFSGHGDRQRIHLGGERVALADIDAKLAAIPASLRIIIVDACRTADVRGKGVATEDAFAITLDGATAASGVVRIHASADGEVAQESDELGGAVFTHYLVTGLAGAADADADARVTLAEAYSFAYSQTLYRSARATGALQRPSVQLDLKEAAPVVLTRTATVSSLVVPRAADAHYLVYALGSRTVVGEVWSSADRPISVAVAPGKYVVHRRAGGRSAAAQIDVGRGEHRALGAADFKAVPEEKLARKGGDLLLRPHEIGASYELLTSRLAAVGHRFGLGYAYSWEGGWALSAGVFGGLGTREASAQTSELAWIGLDGSLEQRVRLGLGTLRFGAGPRAMGIAQSLRREDSARLARAGYATSRTFHGAAFGAHALAAVRVPLSHALWVELDARGDLLGGRIEDELDLLWSAGLGAAFGATF
ncbi:MAG: caspase family protein [Labilithrix sp.]|nr:caspase family protein [Labilithrix sp.]MCW5810848.1 caspase family protein [Labilithrix sp.]